MVGRWSTGHYAVSRDGGRGLAFGERDIWRILCDVGHVVSMTRYTDADVSVHVLQRNPT